MIKVNNLLPSCLYFQTYLCVGVFNLTLEFDYLFNIQTLCLRWNNIADICNLLKKVCRVKYLSNGSFAL